MRAMHDCIGSNGKGPVALFALANTGSRCFVGFLGGAVRASWTPIPTLLLKPFPSFLLIRKHLHEFKNANGDLAHRNILTL